MVLAGNQSRVAAAAAGTVSMRRLIVLAACPAGGQTANVLDGDTFDLAGERIRAVGHRLARRRPGVPA
jgi:hypothetical protein